MLAIDPANLKSVSEAAFDVSDLGNLPVIGMLYQTGYLTIKEYKSAYLGGIFDLGVPDEEVRQDLSALMTNLVSNKDVLWAVNIGAKLLEGDWPAFFDGLAALYAGAVYGTTEGKPHELSYARCLKFLLQGQGFRVEQDVSHAGGRTDIVADHPCGTYIFELKVNKPPKVAMSQVQRASRASLSACRTRSRASSASRKPVRSTSPAIHGLRKVEGLRHSTEGRTRWARLRARGTTSCSPTARAS